MQRPDPSYPIWDNNTTTVTVPAGTGDINKTVPDGVYYMVVTANGTSQQLWLRDDVATTASTGIHLEDGAPGPTNFGIHIAAGTLYRITRSGSIGCTITYFYNTI